MLPLGLERLSLLVKHQHTIPSRHLSLQRPIRPFIPGSRIEHRTTQRDEACCPGLAAPKPSQQGTSYAAHIPRALQSDHQLSSADSNSDDSHPRQRRKQSFRSLTQRWGRCDGSRVTTSASIICPKIMHKLPQPQRISSQQTPRWTTKCPD